MFYFLERFDFFWTIFKFFVTSFFPRTMTVQSNKIEFVKKRGKYWWNSKKTFKKRQWSWCWWQTMMMWLAVIFRYRRSTRISQRKQVFFFCTFFWFYLINIYSILNWRFKKRHDKTRHEIDLKCVCWNCPGMCVLKLYMKCVCWNCTWNETLLKLESI